MTLIRLNSICEIAFTTAPLSNTPTWTDVSSRLKSYSIKSGRDHELKVTDPAQATIVLESNDGALDPSNTTGTYGANVTVGRRIRVREKFNFLAKVDSLGYEILNVGTSSWTGFTNCTVQTSDGAATAITLGSIMELKATGAGAFSANTPTGTAGVAVTPGDTIVGMIDAASDTATPTFRSVTVGISFYTAAGAFISASTAAVTETNSSTHGDNASVSWATATTGAVTVPGTAAFAALTLSVASAAANERHWFRYATIQPAMPTNVWTPGVQTVFDGFIESYSPAYSLREQQLVTITAFDLLQRWNRIRPVPDSVYAAGVMVAKPLQWWRFGEADGATVVLDSTNNGLNGAYALTNAGIATDDTGKVVNFVPSRQSLAAGTTNAARWVYGNSSTTYAVATYTAATDLPGLAPVFTGGSGWSMPAFTATCLWQQNPSQVPASDHLNNAHGGYWGSFRLWLVGISDTGNMTLNLADFPASAPFVSGTVDLRRVGVVAFTLSVNGAAASLTASWKGGSETITTTQFCTTAAATNPWGPCGAVFITGGSNAPVGGFQIDEWAVFTGAAAHSATWAHANGTTTDTESGTYMAALTGVTVGSPFTGLGVTYNGILAPKAILDTSAMSADTTLTVNSALQISLGPSYKAGSASNTTAVTVVGVGTTDTPYVDQPKIEHSTQTCVNYITETVVGTGSIVFQDATRIANYQTVAASLQVYPGYESVGSTILARHGAQTWRISSVTIDTITPKGLAQALQRVIGDWVSVQVLTSDGRTLTQRSRIEGITRTRSGPESWAVEWKVSPI